MSELVKLTDEERCKRLLHPMAVKMKERVDDIELLVTEKGPAGIPKNKLEGSLFLGGVGSIGTVRRYLKSLLEADRLVLYSGVYYTPENYQLRAMERVEDDSELLRKREEERERAKQTREEEAEGAQEVLESHTHTIVGRLLTNESIAAQGGES